MKYITKFMPKIKKVLSESSKIDGVCYLLELLNEFEDPDIGYYSLYRHSSNRY